ADPLDEARLIGSALRDLHHREAVDYDDMAVVCRSGAAVADVADLLSRTGLPVRVPRRPQPLRDVAVVGDLLTILALGLAPAGTPREARTATALLRGPFGDADDLRLRRIRRLLLAAHRAEEASAAGEDLTRSRESRESGSEEPASAEHRTEDAPAPPVTSEE